MHESLVDLSRFLASYADVPESEVSHLASLLKERLLPKGNFFTRVGEHPREFALVLAGMIRKFYVTQDGRQMTRGFAVRGELVGAYAALLTRTESSLSIEALADSRLLVLDFAAFESLYSRHSCWNVVGRRVAEMLFVQREQREGALLTLTAEQRYQKFREEQPDIVQSVPQYQIASYLGITPVSLSRIRARMQRRGVKEERR